MKYFQGIGLTLFLLVFGAAAGFLPSSPQPVSPMTAEAVLAGGEDAEAWTGAVCSQETSERTCSPAREEQLVVLASESCWPVPGRVTSRFGYRRSPFLRVIRFHEGVDIASPRGTPVVSSADGLVIYAGYRGGLGRAVIIAHGLGLFSVYGHASRLFVTKGEWVERGTIIASVGSTGSSTGPHLHYEILVDGVPMDPLRYFYQEL
jgi:murein DD-endopeptidase MepM/ murein hydrolase activator NlpD